MYRLICFSNEEIELSKPELLQTFAKFRDLYNVYGLTGILQYTGQRFTYLIEGDEEMVLNFFKTAFSGDTQRINVVLEEPIVSRWFGEWGSAASEKDMHLILEEDKLVEDKSGNRINISMRTHFI